MIPAQENQSNSINQNSIEGEKGPIQPMTIPVVIVHILIETWDE